MTIGKEISAARKEKRMTKAELAKKLRIHPAQITRVEADSLKPSREMLAKLSDALCLDEDRLYVLSGLIPPRYSRSVADSPDALLAFCKESIQSEKDVNSETELRQFALPLSLDPFASLLPKEHTPPHADYSIWEIDQTISELSYLAHNFVRYYGKFPSTLPKALLARYPVRSEEYVLDNFAGSGTTLLEAQLAGFCSIGIDVNPVAVLACRAKTKHFSPKEIGTSLQILLQSEWQKLRIPDSDESRALLDWMSEENLRKLYSIGLSLPQLRPDMLEFFSCCLLAILRRCTVAYDGEVRPHRNPKKKPQDPFVAFKRKANDMATRLTKTFDLIGRKRATSSVLQGDCRERQTLEELKGKKIGLVISHPPYLNCFDYIPVYRLELALARLVGVAIPGVDFSYSNARKRELRAWPAKSEADVNTYLEGLVQSYASITPFLTPSANICVVVGDCTMKKELIPVHSLLRDRLVKSGFRLKETIYRTTSYGTGKYAYDFRADYHPHEAGKKDAIMVFAVE
jgi:DNA modification methylase/transcriptional regulator with XRE-family HTH domain